MARKIQVPAIGGLRKVIKVGSDEQTINPGTTIAEFANQRITLAQLRAALGLTSTIINGGGGSTAPSAAIVPGPGLSGGGALVGAVPLNLTLPLALIPEDVPMDERVPIPGPPGMQGVQGPPGIVTVEENTSDVEVIYPVKSPQRSILSGTWTNPGSPNLIFVYCPNGGSIMGVRLMTEGGTGSCVVDVLKKPFGSFPPAGGDSITAAAIPTISSGIKYEDVTLTGWTRRIDAGDVIAFKLNSFSTFTSIHVSLEVQE